MDGVIDELLRLEGAKHKALLEFDSSSYSESVKTQNRLLNGRSAWSGSPAGSAEKLAELSKLLRLNSALYHNLLSISPWIALASNGYTPAGKVASMSGANRFSAEV